MLPDVKIVLFSALYLIYSLYTGITTSHSLCKPHHYQIFSPFRQKI